MGIRLIPTYAKHFWSDNAVNTYLSRGVPASKLTMGVPFYGRGWGGVAAGPNGDGLYQTASGNPPRGKYENGIDDYKEMIAREATFKKYFQPTAQSVYIYNGSQLWTYDDPASMTNKMNYIKSKNLSGVMFWELSGDTTSIALLSAIYNGLNSGTPSPNEYSGSGNQYTDPTNSDIYNKCANQYICPANQYIDSTDGYVYDNWPDEYAYPADQYTRPTHCYVHCSNRYKRW